MGEDTRKSHKKDLITQKKKNVNTDGDITPIVPCNVFPLLQDLSLNLNAIEDEKGFFDNYISENEEFIPNVADENNYFKKMLNGKDKEVKKVKKNFGETSQSSGSLSSDIAAIKIVELSRKIRDTTAELETEKTKNKILHRTVKELEMKTRSEVNGNPAKIVSEIEGKSDLTVELREKLNSSVSRLNEYRNICQSLKRDLKIAHKVLQQEVGDGATLQTALSGTGWRGRSQQILSLQSKVAELKDQLEKKPANGVSVDEKKSSALNSGMNVIESKQKDLVKKLEKDRKEENEKLLSDLKIYASEQVQLKEKLLASKARINIITNDNQKLKVRISTLITKAEHDDELIRAYTDQMSVLQETAKLLRNQQGTESDINEVKREYQEEVEKLRKIIKDREDYIINLQDEIENIKKTKTHRSIASHSTQGSSSAPVSRSNTNLVDSATLTMHTVRSSEFLTESRNGLLPELRVTEDGRCEIEELHLMCNEYRTVAQAAQVEKEKLLELVTILNKRVDEATTRAVTAEERIHSIHLKNVQLEKQTEKANLEATGKGNRRSLFSSSRVTIELDSTIAELKAQVKLLKDEKLVLQNTLQSLLKAKEDDLKIYQDIISHAQDIFSKGLHQNSGR